MTTGFQQSGVDFDSIFHPRTGSDPKAPDVGYNVSGTDVSNLYYPLSSGGTSPSATGFKAGGVDLSNRFAANGSVAAGTVPLFSAYPTTDFATINGQPALWGDYVAGSSLNLTFNAPTTFDVYDYNMQIIYRHITPADGTSVSIPTVPGHFYGNRVSYLYNNFWSGFVAYVWPTIPTRVTDFYQEVSFTETAFVPDGHYVWSTVPFNIPIASGGSYTGPALQSGSFFYVKLDLAPGSSNNMHGWIIQ